MNVSLQNRKTFGENLKFWRKLKKRSQMELALDLGISAKHLSFVETGRSKPSRELVCKLASALKLPLREQNIFLNSAGYNSEFREASLENSQLIIIKESLERMLENHNPYPAFVINTSYDILMTNSSYRDLVAFFIGKNKSKEFTNVMELTFHRDGLSSFIQDWNLISDFLLSRIWDEMITTGNPKLEVLYKKLTESRRKNEKEVLRSNSEHNLPVFSLTLTKNKKSLRFFSMITTFGTPLDLTCQELRIESMYPADEVTKSFFLK
ncbi:MAG: helix-turn-helix transcriptional regulator [Leptospira sp.]|jgi:transcriptional regulator with XRE-family HTH domain|nr:helix-turn-helix transcriptional regulator [Leptospira sp.]